MLYRDHRLCDITSPYVECMETTATSLGHPVYDHKTNSIWHLSQNDVQPLVKYLMTIITKLLLLTYVSYAPVNLCPAKWSKFFCVFKICYVHHVCCLNQQLLRNNNHKWHYKVSFVKLYWFGHWYTHTHTHLFNGPLSGTTRVSRYQR